MSFKKWLENYQNVNQEDELNKIRNINMTANLPTSEKPTELGTLTRGFHLNTIVGRMMHRWIGGLTFAPVDWLLHKSDPKKAYKWRVSETDKSANNNYKAAYEMFKQEIANAVDALPFKKGFNINTGRYEDVMKKSKDFFANYVTYEQNLIDSLNKAWKIYTSVFGNDNKRNYGQIQNFMNFLQIVRDEFMTIGENLPQIGNDDDTRRIQNELVKDIEREIKKYEIMIS